MSDRELLGLAAKAAGYSVRWYEDSLAYGPTFGIEVEPGNPCGFEVWNPLTDDGDALRLAVKLKLQVILYSDWVEVLQDGIQKSNAHSVYDAGCMFKCARRAIVLAAAELGRAMP